MSTVAASRVDVRIAVDAGGNASRVVADTRRQLDDMGDSAEEATEGAKRSWNDWAVLAQQKMGQLGGVMGQFQGLVDSTAPPIAKVGQGLQLAASIGGMIPGPIGVAVGVATQLGTALYTVAKAASETEAKTRYMRDQAGTDSLAKGLSISADAAYDLRNALQDLAEDGAAPTQEVLRIVRDRAVAMGQDGEKAVLGWVDATAKGADAFRALQKTVGDVNATSLKDVAARVGITKETLGIAKDENDLKAKALELTNQAAAAEASISVLTTRRNEMAKETMRVGVVARIEKEKERSKFEEIFDAEKARLEQIKKQSAAIEQQAANVRTVARLTEEQGRATTLVASRTALIDFQAENSRNRQVGLGLRLQSIDLRRTDIIARMEALEANKTKYNAEQYELARNSLTLELQQNEAAQKTVLEDKAYRDEQAAKAKERLASETAAQMRLTQARLATAAAGAKDPVLDPAVIALKQKIIDDERKAAIKDAKDKSNTAKGRVADLQAIELEAKNKRIALDKEISDKQAELAQSSADVRKQLLEDSLTAEREAQDALDELNKAKREREIQDLNDRGEFHKAALAEITLAEEQSAAAIDKINQDLAIKLVDYDEGSAEAARERLVAESRIAAERQALATKTAEVFKREAEATTQAFEMQVDKVNTLVGSTIDNSGLLISSAFTKQIEAAQKSVDQLEGNAAKIGKEQIEALQDQAKSAAETVASFKILGNSVASITKNVGGGMKAWEAYGKASKSGNTEELTKATESLSGALTGTIAASGAAAAAFVDDEKTKAGILALTETAASIASFATGDIVGGVGHGAAAAIYAGIAGGAIPSGGAGAGGGATAGATTGGGGEIVGTTGNVGGGGAGVTQVFNFNKGFVIGSTQEVAKGISGTLRSVNGTGYDRRKAA